MILMTQQRPPEVPKKLRKGLISHGFMFIFQVQTTSVQSFMLLNSINVVTLHLPQFHSPTPSHPICNPLSTRTTPTACCANPALWWTQSWFPVPLAYHPDLHPWGFCHGDFFQRFFGVWCNDLVNPQQVTTVPTPWGPKSKRQHTKMLGCHYHPPSLHRATHPWRDPPFLARRKHIPDHLPQGQNQCVSKSGTLQTIFSKPFESW